MKKNTEARPRWKNFVVSLKRVRERRLRVIRQMNALNQPFEIVDACDAKQVRPELLVCGPRPWDLSNGEVATYYSHLGLMERIVDYGLDYAIVLEDDFLFGNAQRLTMDNVHELMPVDADHIQLHDIRDHFSKEYAVAERGELFNRLSCTNVMTVGYMISRRLAEYLLTYHPLPRMPIDHQLIEISKQQIFNYYDVNERLIDADWGGKSEIDDRR
ncbi:MAG: glycosyl transferase, family 25 [Akkermansiaceae bacterium]|nr:glycosyl transferase, family 25 [Akkermansiaceae bacterium]